MRVYLVVYSLIGQCICLTYALKVRRSLHHQSQSNSPLKPGKDASSLIADETINLINAGRQQIPFNAANKKVVLMVGNTGAGKTTMAKFISGKPLISYNTAGRNLLKDAAGKISHGSTLVSKTIFPDVFVDETSGTVYYDLPGFSDTRNASVELANAWFMKLVADHATDVKIILVVTHSSLRPGESRTDFKALLEHATSFILDPAKFRPGIALVASKVDYYMPDEIVVSGIAGFLELERNNLHEIFGSDKKKLGQVLDLVDSFLVQSPGGVYERIGYFKQPSEVGPIDKMPKMILRRRALNDMIDNRLQYVRKEDKDFGISISDAARFHVAVIVEKLSSKFTDLTVQLATLIQQHYNRHQTTNNPVESFLGKFIQEIAGLETLINNLTKSDSRQSFVQVLEQNLSTLPGSTAILKELKDLHENLEFYANIATRSNAIPTKDWALPLRTALTHVKQEASKLLNNLNIKAESWVAEIGKTLYNSYDKIIEDSLTGSNSGQQAMIKTNLIKDLQLLETLKNDLPKQISFNSFWNAVTRSIGALSVKVVGNSAPLLVDDIVLLGHPQLRIDSWIRPVVQLLQSISSKQAHFNKIMQEREREAKVHALNAKYATQLQENARVAKIAEEINRRVSEANLQRKHKSEGTADARQRLEEESSQILVEIENLKKEKARLEAIVKADEQKITKNDADLIAIQQSLANVKQSKDNDENQARQSETNMRNHVTSTINDYKSYVRRVLRI